MAESGRSCDIWRGAGAYGGVFDDPLECAPSFKNRGARGGAGDVD
jgi:hypothetical protein